MIIVLAFVLIIVPWIFKACTKDQSFFTVIPGPKCYPLIGNAYLYVAKSLPKRFEMMCEHFARFPVYFKYEVCLKKILCVSDPDMIQQVLNSHDCQNKPYMYKFFDVDYGLLSAPYSDWKLYRKMLNPAFNLKILVSFIPIFEDCSKIMVDSLLSHNAGPEFDVFHYASRCTLEMICRSSLGSDVAADPKTMEFCFYLEELLTLLSKRWFNPLIHNDWIYQLTATYRREKKLRDNMEEIIKPVIQQKMNIDKQRQDRNNVEDEETTVRKPMIFVEQLLTMERSGQQITHTEIQCHIYTIIAAGNETSALQASFVLLMLGMFPDAQQKVLQEIEDIYSGQPTLSHDCLQNQQYLDLVIKETMRLFPVGPIVGRESIRPVRIGSLSIPTGVTILMNFYTLHRRSDIWGPNSDRFYPERFREENFSAKHSACFFPFAGGPRNCIGYRYAMLTMKAIVTQVVWRYQIMSRLKLENIRLSHDITLKLLGGHLISIVERNTLNGNNSVIVSQ